MSTLCESLYKGVSGPHVELMVHYLIRFHSFLQVFSKRATPTQWFYEKGTMKG